MNLNLDAETLKNKHKNYSSIWKHLNSCCFCVYLNRIHIWIYSRVGFQVRHTVCVCVDFVVPVLFYFRNCLSIYIQYIFWGAIITLSRSSSFMTLENGIFNELILNRIFTV